MPQQAWSAKRERQYEHIKDSLEGAGHLRGQGRGDRRPHREQGAGARRRGEDVVAAVPDGHVVRAARRTALRDEPAEGPDARPALQRGARTWASRAARR